MPWKNILQRILSAILLVFILTYLNDFIFSDPRPIMTHIKIALIMGPIVGLIFYFVDQVKKNKRTRN